MTAPVALLLRGETREKGRLASGGIAMTIRYVGATEQQRERMDESQKIIRKCIKDKRAKIPPPLLEELKDMLDDKRTVIEVEVKKDEQLGFPEPSQGNWAHWGSGGGRYIEINSRCFDPWTKKGKEKPPRLTAVLLHEMVHIAGGNELDAESFENILVSEKDGAVPPSKEDEKEFRDCKYCGVYVSMNRKTRRVSFPGTEDTSRAITPSAPRVTVGTLKREQEAPAKKK